MAELELTPLAVPSRGEYFSIALKDQAVHVEPDDWVTLPFETGLWLPDGYALLTVQLYAEMWDDWCGPTDIRTRLDRQKPDRSIDFTAESVHPIANDWAIDRTTMMYCRADTPVAVTIRVLQAPITLHTLIYRGVTLPLVADTAARDAAWEDALTHGLAWPTTR